MQMTPEQFQSERVEARACSQATSILLRIAKPLFESSVSPVDNTPCWDGSRTFEMWWVLRQVVQSILDHHSVLLAPCDTEKMIEALDYAHKHFHAHNAALAEVVCSVEYCPCEVARIERDLGAVLVEGTLNA